MASRGEPELRLFDTSEELNSCLADYVYQISESAINEKGSFSLVLSGGDILNRLGKLTRPPFLKTMEWSKWHIFWAEENVVPNKRHPDSFYRQATEAFISKVPILPTHVFSVSHGVPGETAANSYEFSIRQQVRKRTVPVSPSSDCPRFDLVLLTLGKNSDVASLSPNHPVLEEDSVEDLSKLKHNLAAKRSRDRKKQERLRSQASTSSVQPKINLLLRDDIGIKGKNKDKMLTGVNADVADADVADVDVAEMLKWQDDVANDRA